MTGVLASWDLGGPVIIMKIIKTVTHLREDEVEEELDLDVTEQEESACGEDWGV
jgi:ammonia channel protein AmtB